jgi:hypothetical protein
MIAAEHSETPGSYVLISDDWEAVSGRLVCEDGGDFTYNYLQRMTYRGRQVGPGRGDQRVRARSSRAHFFGTCGGYDIYGVGSCACSTAAQVAESDLADDLICPADGAPDALRHRHRDRGTHAQPGRRAPTAKPCGDGPHSVGPS